MKKTLLVIVLTVLALLVLAVAGLAYAQSQTPPAPGTSGDDFGPWGMMGRRGFGMMGWHGMMGGIGSGFGPMHEYMVDALAEALDLSPEDVQTRIQAGETPWQIAQSEGLSDEEISDLMVKVHEQALDAAVAAGALTQEQADWMKEHMQQRWENGAGFGPCHGGARPPSSPTSGQSS